MGSDSSIEMLRDERALMGVGYCEVGNAVKSALIRLKLMNIF